MRRRFVIACLCAAILTAVQISASAQEITLQPQTIEPGDCTPVQTGRPSKLVEAIRAGKFPEFKKLLEDGEDVDALDYESETPLMAAVTYDKIEFLAELIKARADVNKANSIGWTPLMYAARSGRSDHTAMLIAAGADVDGRDRDGQTPLLKAARDATLEIVEMLLAAGANLHHKDNSGRTAFLLSAEGGNVKIVKKLLSLGFDPNSYSDGGYTALVGAARSPEVLKALIAAGAKVNFQRVWAGMGSMTALQAAAQNGWTESVRVLLAAGADPNLYHTPGVLPLDKPLRKNYTEIVEMLRRAGAKTWAEMEKVAPRSDP